MITPSLGCKKDAHLSRLLQFLDLSIRHYGLTNGISESYAEAARVCLDRHHASPIEFQIRDNNGDEIKMTAQWDQADERTRSAWANDNDATEAGAYGLALAAIEEMRGLVAISRAETRTGADYYLGTPGNNLSDLENSIRFEVSGMDRGNYSAIKRRLEKKIGQAQKGASNLPAIASVVGFEAMVIHSSDC